MKSLNKPLIIVVGAGGVGKTTLAAALALEKARSGDDTLVMTFDPSLRLKDTLGIGDHEDADEVEVQASAPGRLTASLLDARRTFDHLIETYAPDEATKERILNNRFYDHLGGSLAGMMEYMASERLFEVYSSGRFDTIILDTPPTRQALDFLQAPERIVGFLDTGGPKMAAKNWFDDKGRLRVTSKLGILGRNVDAFFDRMVGLELLQDMAEFFQAFAPFFDGFRERALEVQKLLKSPGTIFVLVSGPGPQRVADTLFFARKLMEADYHLGPILVNRVHPGKILEGIAPPGMETDGRKLLQWLGSRDAEGVRDLKDLLGGSHPLGVIGLRPDEPTDIEALGELGGIVSESLN